MTAPLTCAIVTFNSAQVIEACLQALRLQLEDAQILIYDNNSQDQTVERIAAISPSIRVVCGPRNIGFGRAINSLRSEVGTPYLLLLNPDAVIQAGAIAELLDVVENESAAAVVGAVQKTADGSFVGPEPSQTRYREVDCVFGAAMLLRLAHFPSNSPWFDPRFWMYYEDQDLCLAATARGHRILLANRAFISHEPGRSSVLPSPAKTLAIKRRQYLEYLIAGHVFRYKHCGRLRTLARALASMVFSYGKYIRLLVKQDPGRYPVYQRSLACFLFYFRLFG